MTRTEQPVLAGYQGMRRLGGGGQGEVYLATDGGGRRVVVKVARGDRPGAAASLEREAAALARLGPPSTPRLLARATTEGGEPALVVEHVPWPDLRRVLKERGVLAVPEALAIGEAIIAALGAVHRAGLVHGDLAPANVLCRVAPPAVRLIDVGASATARAEPVLATLPYAAPELLEADAAPDRRSDLYGLGAVLHEIVTGEPPFAGEAGELRRAHRTGRAPPVSRRPGVPRALDEALARAMAKRPEDRHADAGELLEAWRAACDGAASAAAAPAPASAIEGSIAAAGTADGAAAALAPGRRRVVLLGFAGPGSLSEAADLVHAHRGAIALSEPRRHVAAFWRGDAPADAGAVAAELAGRGWHVEVEETSLKVDLTALPPRFRGAAIIALARRLDERPRVEPPARAEPPLVGRDDELDGLVRSARATFEERRGAIDVVAAAPGLGKSRLAVALADRLRGEGLPVVLARAADARLGPPGPAALLALLGETAADPRARLIERLAVADPVDGAALLVATGSAPARSASLTDPLRAAPGALRQAAARALADAIAARGPVCLVLDDAHRADPLVLDAIELATLRERNAPIWVALFARPSLLRARPHLGSRAARHRRRELAALGTEHGRVLCRALLADVDALPVAVIDRLVARAGGVPLLLCELVAAVRRDRLRTRPRGGSYLETDRLTAPSDAAILAWAAQGELDALSAGLAAFCRLVAMVGEVELATLTSVIAELERGGERVTSWEPAVAAARLVEAGLLVERDGALEVRHALLREAIAAQVEPAAARAIHAAAARALVQPAARAAHAAAAGLRAEAAAAWLEVAAGAASRHAYVDGDEALSRALEQLDAGDPRRVAALRGRAMARFRLGRHDDAMADFARARAVVAGAGDDVDLEVDLLLDEAVALDWAGDFDGAARLTARALGAHASPRPLRAARLAMADGRIRWRGGDLPGAIGPLERAVALAEACGEDGYETWVAALAMLGFLLPTVGELDRAEACLTRALDGADARRDQLHRAAVIGNRYLLCSVRGELDRLAADMAEYTRLARELGMPGNEYRGELNQAVHAQYLGRQGDAALHAARARGFEERMPDLFPAASAALLLAQIAARRGQREQASAWLGEVRGRAPAGAEERAIAWALERWLAGDLEPGPWIAAAERSAGQGAPETGCELLDLLAAELDRQGRAIDARDLRRRAAALPGVPAFLAHRLAIHDDGAPGCP